MGEFLHGALTKRVISVYFEVYNELGFGFLEVVYQRAMSVAFAERGIAFVPQAPLQVIYHSRSVGLYFADFLVDGALIVELKVARAIDSAHESQLLHYLRATDVEVGLLFNFGERPSFRRLVFSNDRKANRR